MKPHVAFIFLAVLTGCPGEQVDDSLRRGHETDIAPLSAEQRAGAYATALRSAFDIPGTTLLVDPRMLAATGGYDDAEDRMPDEVIRALMATGTVQGQCIPEPEGENRAPTCEFVQAGYAVRFSDIFDAEADTTRLNLMAERYRTAGEVGYASAFRMEERYHLARAPRGWRVTRKERMRL